MPEQTKERAARHVMKTSYQTGPLEGDVTMISLERKPGEDETVFLRRFASSLAKAKEAVPKWEAPERGE